MRETVSGNQVVTLVADWTKYDDEITTMLEALGSKQLPVIAVFPAGRPNDVQILTGLYTKSALLKALETAGPSASVAKASQEPGVIAARK